MGIDRLYFIHLKNIIKKPFQQIKNDILYIYIFTKLILQSSHNTDKKILLAISYYNNYLLTITLKDKELKVTQKKEHFALLGVETRLLSLKI